MEKVYRAYSVLENKGFDEDDDKLVVEGLASTPTPDRYLDIVEPKGAKFQTPMPLLWQHAHDKPVGHVTFARPDSKGIPFRSEIPKIKEAGVLKDRIDEAIQSLKYKLVSAVSIGFKPLEYFYLDNGGIHFLEWEWYELSLVTIPAQSEAVITAVKSVDKAFLSALGHQEMQKTALTPGVSGKRRPIQLIPRGK